MATDVAARKKSTVLGDRTLLKVAVRFFVCFGVLFAVIAWLNMRTSLINELEATTAAAATGLINLTGVVATRTDVFINLPGRQLLIGPDCTGLTIVAVLTALVVAYPVKPSSRIVGVLFGVVAILAANLLRLVAIAHLASAPDAIFYAMHDFLFQVGMVAVGIAVWAAWLSYARARES